MNIFRFFLAYGILILGLFATANYRGWSMTSYNEVKNVPKSVRENPGTYRSHYAYQRYYHK